MRPIDGRDARDRLGLLCTELFALPNGNALVGFAYEKHFAEAWVGVLRTEDEASFFLVYPTEVEEVIVLSEHHGAVGIGR